MKNKLIIFLAIMLVTSSISMISVVADDYEPMSPNYMGFTESVKHVTIGDTFYSYIYGDINSEIDTIAAENLTYLPAGILENIQLSVAASKGNLFNDDYTLVFSRATIINDAAGYAKAWVWAIDAPGSTPRVNNTNATAFNTRWAAVGCGIATLTITEGGTAAGGIDPGTTMRTQTIYVHPESTGAFTATPYSTTQINLTWDKYPGADYTVVRYSDVSNPTTPQGGSELYNGTDASTEHSGLSPGEHFYYSAWGYNFTSGLFSIQYQTADAFTNSPPVFDEISPTNGSVNQQISLTWSVRIRDPEGNAFNWRIECSNGQFSFANGATNGTKSLQLTDLDFDTEYTVWVNATDPAGSGTYTREWFTFETVPLDAPAGLTATADGRFAIDLEWTNADYADKTMIRGKLGSYPTDESDGTLIYNGTAEEISHSELSPEDHWYYRAWSWNETKEEYSPDYAQVNEQTDANQDPTVIVRPGEGTTGVTLYPKIEIEYEDPEGDLMMIVVVLAEKGVPDPMDDPSWVGIIVDKDGEQKFNWIGCKTVQELEDYVSYLENITDPSEIEYPYIGCSNIVDALEEDTEYTIWVKAMDEYGAEVNYTFNFTTGEIINASMDLIYLNSTGTGYNFIAVLNASADATDAAQQLNDHNISWEYLTYWDSGLQAYSSKVLINKNGAMAGSDFNLKAGDVLLVAVLENTSFQYSGFSPTMPWEDIGIVEGWNWLGRTGQNTSAFYLGENLTTGGVNWSMIYYYNQYDQEWSDERFEPADGLGDPADFNISTGMAVMVEINEEGTFRMGGW